MEQRRCRYCRVIEEKAQKVFDNSGASPTQLVFGKNVWKHFRKNKSVKEHLDLRRSVDVGFEVTPKAAINGMRNLGTYGDFQMMVHTGWYKDPIDGQSKFYVPENSVMLLSPGINGTKHFGKIKDRKAKIKAMRYFTKSVEVEDPSALYIIAQFCSFVGAWKNRCQLYRRGGLVIPEWSVEILLNGKLTQAIYDDGQLVAK